MSAIEWDFETVPRVPRRTRGQARHQPRLLHRPLQRAPLGHGRRRLRAGRDRRRRSTRCARSCATRCAAGAAGSRRRTRRPTSTATIDRCRPASASARRVVGAAAAAGETGPGPISYLPYSSIGGRQPEDDEYLLIRSARPAACPIIIQGLGGRNKVDAPTATWDRAVELPRSGHGQRHARLLDPHRAPARSAAAARRRALPLPRRAVVGPHAAAAPRRARRTAARRRRRAHELRTRRRELQPRPGQGHHHPPADVEHRSSSTTSRHDPSTAACEGRTIASLAAKTGVAPGRCHARPRARRRLRHRVPLELGDRRVDRRRSATRRWTTRMIIGTSDGGAHLARDDGADWSSLVPPQLDPRPRGVEPRRRHPPTSRSCRPALPASPTGARSRSASAPTSSCSIPTPSTPAAKSSSATCPGGAGRFKAGRVGRQGHHRQRRADHRRRLPTGRLPGHTVRPSRVA